MSKGQRFTFLAIAAVIAIVAVVVLAGGGDDDRRLGRAGRRDRDAGGDRRAAGGVAAGPRRPRRPSRPRSRRRCLRAGKVTKLKATEGETVRFRVRSDTDEEIHVHAYDIERAVPAGKTVNVAFKANITGIVEIEFHGSGEQIAELTVEPS